MRVQFALLILILNIGGFPVYGQEVGIDETVSTKELFKSGNYRGALRDYKLKLSNDSTNLEYKHKIGACHLYINDDKSKAIPYLEEVVEKDPSNFQAIFDLGKAYHLNLEFDKAIEQYLIYIDKAPDELDKANGERQIEMCNYGKKLVMHPVDVTFENLGRFINSPYPDFSPFVPEDESFIIFSSRRKENRGSLFDFDGFNPSDVYLSNVKKGVFTRSQNIAVINTESEEEAAGITPDGSHILIYVDDIFQNIYGNIYLAQRRGRSFQGLKSIGSTVNSNTSIETSACLSYDGETLFFASDRKEGLGGTDLYYSQKLPNGKWGNPINMGDQINTEYNEDYPTLLKNGKTLYFSSEGHNSMGGYDLFRSNWNENKQEWDTPINIGYPINTPDDNMNISFSAQWDNATEKARNKYAYISTWREDGFGDLDIYRITFNSVAPQLTGIMGTISAKIPIDNSIYQKFYHYGKGNQRIALPEQCHPWKEKGWNFIEEKEVKVRPGYEYKTSLYFEKNGVKKIFSSKKYPKGDPAYKFRHAKTNLIKKKNYVPEKTQYEYKLLPQATIHITNQLTHETFKYLPNSHGKYVAILSPGRYELIVEAEPYLPIKEILILYDKSSYKPEIKKDFILEPPPLEEQSTGD